MKTYNTVKVFNTETCEWETYKRTFCGGWKKVVKCEPKIVVPKYCKPVVCETICYEYTYC